MKFSGLERFSSKRLIICVTAACMLILLFGYVSNRNSSTKLPYPVSAHAIADGLRTGVDLKSEAVMDSYRQQAREQSVDGATTSDRKASDKLNAQTALESAAVIAADASMNVNRDVVVHELLVDIMHKPMVTDVAIASLTNIQEAVTIYGPSQAKVRVFALKLVTRMVSLGEMQLAELEELIQTAGKNLENKANWIKGSQYDYRDLIWIYIQQHDWKTISENPEKFRDSIGLNSTVAQLVRQTLISFFSARVPEQEMYRVISEICRV
jgi:hypothetical protein